MSAGLHPFSIFPLGDSALLIDFGNDISEALNDKVLKFYRLIEKKKLHFISDIVPAYSSLAIHYDLFQIGNHLDRGETAFDFVAALVENIARDFLNSPVREPWKSVRVPVCYAPEFALDMQVLSDRNHLSIDEIIQLHTSRSYRVFMLGFLPGFAYMGLVDEKLSIPRKPEPRQNVPPGSVGIAGLQTAVYPMISPGGWQLIGRTPVAFFDAEREEPVLVRPGDEVTFYSISKDEFEHYQGRHS